MEWEVREVTEDWRTISTGSRLKNRPFGEFRSNVWDHSWSEPFKRVDHSDNRTNSRKSYYENEIIPLFKSENPDWETNEEVRERLEELIKFSNTN